MKVRVKKEFNDKYTGERHKIGDELEVTLTRVNEILAVGNFIELVELTEQAEQNEGQKEDQEEVTEGAAEETESDSDAPEHEDEEPKTTRRKRGNK